MTGTLDRLDAERAIRRTHFRFFQLADLGDFGALGQECFTAGADIEYRIMPGPPQRFHGRDAFVGFMLAGRAPAAARARGGGPVVAHTSAPPDIDWDAGRPRLTGYATVWHWAAANTPTGHPRPADWTTIGLVEDDYQKVDGRWLIARRLITPAAGLVAVGTPPGRGREVPR
ncbi:nuclear transport factor 2 family protein [Frankia sp. CNm7]|uniref:Nuclear transport factor 2 family protein n=1 Tax=Frankia nepalensis TaxID=1836974 RepID=A0A937REP3_9ACTN|nr:nuclear transport factor 2 family protein [Frankia nepalensis]MBL7498121.1 nuclear transport factor 2 family protein [Frankia nepalensis]MBL7509264.1 nuclear transport factor 2 family protein [Frankia nepalensis]MBL7522751.1 nuclear transport factor 2 family protein [Frankia nepalensis]MBL7630801.1 nuclear transport factor 2 family protein [Frankia nepalensis]